jgi:hypothetical protein
VLIPFPDKGLAGTDIIIAIAKSTDLFTTVTPAKAGVQNMFKGLDSGFRRNDGTRLS